MKILTKIITTITAPFKFIGAAFYAFISTFFFYLNELAKMYSSKEDSYFSKKRIESGLAFILGQTAMMIFFIHNLSTLTTYELIALVSIEFAISGYIINHIQKQKKDDK